MAHRPSARQPDAGCVTTTKNLFEVAVLTVSGVKLDDATRQGDKGVFTFRDPRAREVLAEREPMHGKSVPRGVGARGKMQERRISGGRDA